MMHVKDAQYLNNLEDAEQYPVARCAQGPGIHMYHRSTSAAVESMNAANHKMRSKTAVDLLNVWWNLNATSHVLASVAHGNLTQK